MGIKGLAFQKELKRHYPMGNLFAHVIGFTNIDGKGQEGLELSREDSLHGADGAKVVLRDNKGNIVDSLDSPRNSDPKNGQDMVLSLDQRIQTLAYDELNKQCLSQSQSRYGCGIGCTNRRNLGFGQQPCL